ncbi:hypothetical protein [uncultured Kordia sp.]|uniref:hypothetical protein n=1 Tax=uncultured Kordia sp. TaxID=507699 RepID=UPI002639558F|nr:hypothetical protein [uncultured Kordia sp.]
MQKKLAQHLVRNFYLVALLLNVVLPWILAKITVGDRTGEIQMIYILVAAWAVGSLLIYAIYFTIPDYNKEWEKIAAFLFPSILTCPMIVIEFPYCMLPWGINFLFSIICIIIYKEQLKKVVSTT